MTVFLLFEDGGWGPTIIGVFGSKRGAEDEMYLCETGNSHFEYHIEEWTVCT